MTLADYLKSQRTLTQREVDRRTAERDRTRGQYVPPTTHPQYGIARH